LRNDLDGVLALVGEDDAELLPLTLEILVNALRKLVSHEELERQVSEWLDERAARLAGG
jgi:hypothetical protein